MEMEGMPFAMPGTTQKVCIPKDGEKDPGKTSGDKDCKMTDVKTVGNKTTWKARCTKDGEVMTGIGEQTTTSGAYQGKIKLSGKSEGQDMNMTMAYSGKRVGGSCDTGETEKKIKAMLCDTSNFRSTADWISAADHFLQKDSPCTEQRKQLCEKVRSDAPRDAQAYGTLQFHDQNSPGGISVARECKLDMAATTKSICKTLNGKNYNALSAHCPAEAKKYREAQRRKECEGRSYTAETRTADLKKCLSGMKNDDDSPQGATPNKTDKSSGNGVAKSVLDGAKKLKGMFGF